MAPTTVAEALAACLAAVAEHGLLLMQDQRLPSVVGIIAGGPLRGSWWGHPDGASIYHTMLALEDHPDLLETKLVDGKVTYVHRRLWPALVATGLSAAPWQTTGLSAEASWLMDCLARNRDIQLNELPVPAGLTRKRLPEAARELERRLLARGYSVHTPRGAHAKCLETWSRWTERAAPDLKLPGSAAARAELEAAAVGLGPQAPGLVPWRTKSGYRSVASVHHDAKMPA
jgi:hypothetical protein